MLSNGEMLFTVCADYEKYQRQISVLAITNLIDVQPKLSSLFDELHLDELKAVTQEVTLLIRMVQRDIYIL